MRSIQAWIHVLKQTITRLQSNEYPFTHCTVIYTPYNLTKSFVRWFIWERSTCCIGTEDASTLLVRNVHNECPVIFAYTNINAPKP
jgi:hypothetical protein